MAHRLLKDPEFEDDQPDHGCVSLAGIIKTQPTCRKVDRSWRPMHASDLRNLRQSGGVVGDTTLHLPDTKDMHGAAVDSGIQHPSDKCHIGPSAPLHALSTWDHSSSMYDGTDTFQGFAPIAQASNEGARQSEMHYAAAEPYIEVFGRLPDPIRLHEQTGKFDGQVVFIGHPNRDISAHQWSSSSFQWVDIGRYAHSCGKVEGSLALDRLRGIDEPRDTLEYFKLAAENRETLIVQNGRPKDRVTTTRQQLHAGTDIAVSTDSRTDASMATPCISASTQSESRSSLSLTVRVPSMKGVLEDPFVAAAGTFVSKFTDGTYVQGGTVGSTGSLDLTYRFPLKSTTRTSQSNVSAGTFDRKSTQNQTLDFLSAPVLHEIAFGEEAATQHQVSPTTDKHKYGLFLGASQDFFRGRSQLQSNTESSQITTPKQQRSAQNTANLEPTADYALPMTSSASLTYVTSSLDATAAPYAEIQTVATASGASESIASTVNAPAAGLHYSDPDGLRKTQTYEVTNGLSQQAPTPQNFKGPFFAETKPTTHDPTVALSVRISEEDKLVNWFHDGHRPARQKEYTKSLIAAAVTSGTGRHFGAIGETLALQQKGPYANTGPFVRLYENLSEYVEEHRNGCDHSYFTRRWKPAASHHRGSGLDDSMSYFITGGSAPSLPRGALLRPSERVWG